MPRLATIALGLALTAAPVHAGTLDFYLGMARDVPQSGPSIALSRGSAVYVKLQRASGTGYSWAATASSTVVSVANIGSAKEQRSGDGKKGMVGFPVYDIFRISRVAPGDAEIDFALSRGRGAPVQTRKLILGD